MKFGKQLAESRQKYPAEWAENCISYDRLKRFLKERAIPCSLNSLLPSNSLGSIDSVETKHLCQVLKTRLGQLESVVPEFVSILDEDLARLNTFYVQEVDILLQKNAELESSSGNFDESGLRSEYRAILQATVRMEKFIFLNFTGICKILKKHDKLTGIRVSEMYMSRVVSMDFYRSSGISQIKKSLMEKASGILPTATPSSNNDSPSKKQLDRSLGSAANGIGGFPNEALVSNHPTNWFPPAATLNSQKIIITLSGPHGTDIMGSLFENISKYDVHVEDVMFSRLYHNVTCAVLARLNTDNVELFKHLANGARKWEAELRFDVYDEQEKLPSSLEDAPYANRQKFTATLLNQNGLSTKFLSSWTKLLLVHKISVEAMKRLNEGHICVLDVKLSVPFDADLDKIRAEIFQLSSESGTDISLQPNDVFRRSKRLVVMDMDSTLIQQEVIDELAALAGVVSEVKEITHRAMNGEIDFKESLKRRVMLLQGAPVSILDKVRDSLTFSEGAHFLCRALKKLGYKLAVISGGFLPLANYVKNELGLDYAFANQLKVSNDGLSLVGETVGPIVDGERKAELLEVIAQAESIGPEQVIAIGDGANDLFMLAAAGLGIAFNAKPKVQEKARTRINQKSLQNVLYLLGYSDEDINQLVLNPSK